MKKLLFSITCTTISLTCTSQIAAAWDSVGMGMSGGSHYVKALKNNDTLDYIIYAGGDFTTTEGKISNHIAQWTGASSLYSQKGKWSTLGHGVNGEVTALTMFKHKLIAGGAFDSASGIAASHIAQWDSASGWDSLKGILNGQVYALLSFKGALYAGGSFTTANGITVNRIAKWDGTNWSALGAGFDSTVYTLVSYRDTLYAGGAFVTSGGKQASHIAKWNGTLWDSVGKGMNNIVYALDSFNYVLFAGGAFTQAGGINANYIASWNDTQWDSLGAGTNDTVRALTRAGYWQGIIAKTPDEYANTPAIIVGGSFTEAGKQACQYAALFFVFNSYGVSQGWHSLNGLTGPVYAAESSKTGDDYVGGQFDSITANVYSSVPFQTNYIAQFSFILGGGINELSNNSNVLVFPNPSDGVFNYRLKIKNYGLATIEVYNVMGEKVYSTPLNLPQGGDFEINLSSQPSGVYFYRLMTDKKELIGSGKLLIQK